MMKATAASFVMNSLMLVLDQSAFGAGEREWQRYKDPTATVALDTPADWRAGKPTTLPFGQIISFTVPDHAAEFTVSVTPKLRLPEELPLSYVRTFFPPSASFGEPQRSRGDYWNGVRQDVSSGSRAWLGMFYGVAGGTAVAITLSGDAERMAAHEAIFERIVQSVELRRPNATDGLAGA